MSAGGAVPGAKSVLVPAFREHFLDKYFAYRRRYVDYILREAPARASLAVVSEITRLGFMVVGNALCAVILWTLAGGAFARASGASLWPSIFTLCALVPTSFVVLSVCGIVEALRDRRLVQEQTLR